MSLKRKIFISCKDATLLTCKKQENAISFKERIQLKIHLFICTVCALFYKQTNLIHEQFTKMNNESHSSSLHVDETIKINLQQIIDKEIEK